MKKTHTHTERERERDRQTERERERGVLEFIQIIQFGTALVGDLQVYLLLSVSGRLIAQYIFTL